jgi:hypothetical protein
MADDKRGFAASIRVFNTRPPHSFSAANFVAPSYFGRI